MSDARPRPLVCKGRVDGGASRVVADASGWSARGALGVVRFSSPDRPGFFATVTVSEAGAEVLKEDGEIYIGPLASDTLGTVACTHAGASAVCRRSAEDGVVVVRVDAAAEPACWLEVSLAQ